MIGKRVGALVMALALAGGVVATVVDRRAAPEMPASAGSAPPPNRAEPADWCTTGYESIPGGCLAIPTSTPSASLLLYLHGRYAKEQSAEEIDRQRRVAARFTSHGYAVLALRGKLGGCGLAELSDWYCWPSNDRTADTAGEIVAVWRDALGEAEQRVRPDRRFVLGFSNGGYFAGLLASRGLLRADGYVIAHGGPVEPVEPSNGTPPLLLLSADEDVAQDDMLRLDALLTKARWPHDSYARGGAHGLADQDIDAALAFFERRGEPMPLAPPIRGLHRPVHHPHDAGLLAPEASVDDSVKEPDDEPGSAEPEATE